MSSTAADATLRTRCRPYPPEGVRRHACQVEVDGTVRVWDPVAQHYTTCHSLSLGAQRRIRRLAAARVS